MKLWQTKEIFKISGYDKVKKALKSGALRSRKSKCVIYVEHAWLVKWLGYDPLADAERARREAEARRGRVAFVDRTGQRYGKLVALKWERRKKVVGGRVVTKIYWTCRCDCGRTQEVASNCFTIREGRPGLRCLACSERSRHEKVRRFLGRRQRRHFPRLPETSPY